MNNFNFHTVNFTTAGASSASTSNGGIQVDPPSAVRPSSSDQNMNNLDDDLSSSSEEGEADLPVELLVKLVVIALANLNKPEGSTFQEIRRYLDYQGLLSDYTYLRRGMIAGLKSGAVARSESSCKSGIYGRYVLGDGIPIFVGRKKSKTPSSAQNSSRRSSQSRSRK